MEEEKKESSEERIKEVKKTDDELFKEREKLFLDDLEKNPKYKPFYEKYNSVSIPGFQSSWAREKANLLRYKDYYLSQAEKIETNYMEVAKEKLWEIQQRKLFDIQCRWRAKLIDIPDLVTTMDIKHWQSNIRFCPFLTPITEEELNRYISFVEHSSYEDVFDFVFYDSDWQEYEDFKKYYFGDKNVYHEPSPWYEYYELVTGFNSLYLLDDYKEPAEDRYMKAYRDNEKKNKDEKPHAPYIPDPRPMIYNSGDDYMEDFIKTYEDYNTYYLYKCAENVRSSYVDDDLEEAIKILKTADEKIYLSSNKDWETSIIDAAHEYEMRRLVRDLPGAYKSYLFRIENNIPFEKNKYYDHDWYDTYRMEYREHILIGRELLGEPRDFNY